jgi:hypothetical protein
MCFHSDTCAARPSKSNTSEKDPLPTETARGNPNLLRFVIHLRRVATPTTYITDTDRNSVMGIHADASIQGYIQQLHITQSHLLSLDPHGDGEAYWMMRPRDSEIQASLIPMCLTHRRMTCDHVCHIDFNPDKV